MGKILLDTNFLIDVVRYKIDFDEIGELAGGKLTVVKPVLNELKKIAAAGSKERGFAGVALMVLKRKNVEIIETGERRADEAIFSMAEKNIVATNDIELRKRLKALGIKIIYLRAKKHLAIS